MVSVVRIHEPGAPEVLKVESIEQQVPGAGEVWIEQAAIGVNPLDVSQRKGDVKIPLPNGLGLEGADRLRDARRGVRRVLGLQPALGVGSRGSLSGPCGG